MAAISEPPSVISASPMNISTDETAPAARAPAPDRDGWTRSYDYFAALQEEVNYIRSIDSHATFTRELESKIAASKDAKKIRKIIDKGLRGLIDAKFRLLAEAIRTASHGKESAQSALWGGLLVALAWSFVKLDYLQLIVELLERMAEALPSFEQAKLDVLGAASGGLKDAAQRKEIQEAIRKIYLQVTEFTHSTAMTLYMKLGFPNALPMGAFSWRLTQTMTMPFFKKTLKEDFEQNLARIQQEARDFNAAVGRK